MGIWASSSAMKFSFWCVRRNVAYLARVFRLIHDLSSVYAASSFELVYLVIVDLKAREENLVLLS